MTGRKRLLFWIVALAALVRVGFLFGFPVDDDEYYTWKNAEHLLDDPAPQAVGAYPLTFVLTRTLLEIFGQNVFGLRLLPVVAGVLAVWFIARVGRQIVSETAALGAALLLAVWPWHQYFSGLGRYYALLFLLAIFLLHFAVRLTDRLSGKDGLAAASCLALLGLTHPTGLFAGAALVPSAVGGKQRGMRALPVAALAVVAVVLVFAVPSLRAPIVRVLSGAGGHGYDALHVGYGLALNVTPVLLVLAACGAWTVRRERPDRARLLLASALVPLVAVGALALCGYEVQPRYTLVGMPALVLLAGAGLERVTRPFADRKGLQATVLGAVLAAFIPSVASNLADGDRHDFHGAALFLRDRLQPHDILLSEGHGLLRIELFGFERTLPPGVRAPPGPGAVDPVADGLGPPHPWVFEELPPDAQALDVIDAMHQHAWFLVPANQWEAPPSKEARHCVDWLRTHARRVARFGARRADYHRNVLYLFECGARA